MAQCAGLSVLRDAAAWHGSRPLFQATPKTAASHRVMLPAGTDAALCTVRVRGCASLGGQSPRTLALYAVLRMAAEALQSRARRQRGSWPAPAAVPRGIRRMQQDRRRQSQRMTAVQQSEGAGHRRVLHLGLMPHAQLVLLE